MNARFIFPTYVAVRAETLDEAERIVAGFFPTHDWTDVGDGVEVFDPGEHVDVVDDDDPECVCPPDLVARGGFKGGCPVHSLTFSSVFGEGTNG